MQTTKQRSIYILADYLSANVAWFAFNIIRYYTLPYNYGLMTLGGYMSMTTVLLGQVFFPLMMILLYGISGYYNKVFFKSRLDDVLNAGAVSLAGTLIIFFTVLFNDKIDDRLGNFEMILILWALFFFITSVPRVCITSNATTKIRRREISFDALVIGTSPQAFSLARDLETKHNNMGFHIVGFVKNGEPDNQDIPKGVPVYDYTDLDLAMGVTGASALILVPGKNSLQHTLDTINHLLPTGKSVFITPDLYHFITSRPRTAMVAGQVLIDVSKANIPGSTANLKRLGDIVGAALALIVLSPVLAAIAILVKRDSKGPVIYAQERIGYKKKPFKIYKFRTMRNDAEAQGPALSASDDPRITRIGRVLRKYRLDELPQFWNVLKGDMSIVGPRPEREYYVRQIIQRAPYYALVHQVRPGITSWGMVKYGYAQNVDEMVERLQWDLLYLENISFAIDLKILFYTVRTVVTGKGI
ncbi:MAG: sugar transferase [Bacteroidales bacterium]|nr:sugar transferase [Bacteroidales bacterium]